MKNLFKVSFLVLGLAAVPGLASKPVQSKLTIHEELIYSVKGIKNGVALLIGVVNPLAGLMAAAYQPDESNEDIMKIDFLLWKGANIDFQEAHSGYTSLIYAAYKGYPGIAAHLINRGANPQIKEKKGYN